MPLCGGTYLRCSNTYASKQARPASQWCRLTTGCATTFTAPKPAKNAPQEVIRNAWQRYVFRKDSSVDIHAYTFCVLHQLLTALHRRDVFTKPSWRYADPRANLLGESEWEAMRPVVCRTLGLSAQPQPVLEALRAELDRTYREVAQRLPNNPAVRFETTFKKVITSGPASAISSWIQAVEARATIENQLWE